MKEVYIVSAMRTPVGSFGGVLSSLSATKLGSIAIKAALEKVNVPAKEVDEVFFGNVVPSNLGQGPARQAALGAGIPNHVVCTTLNKLCASGMKAIMFGAQSIMLGINDVVIAGGMESMSNIPFYVPNARWGYKYGGGEFLDGLVRDGLNNAYDNLPMGTFADATAKKYGISREEQDRFAIQSYKRSAAATEKGLFKNEIVPVTIAGRKGDTIVTEDEEYKKIDFNKVSSLRAAFTKDGTVTAANASTINDGASAVLLMSYRKMKELGLTPLAKIVSFADAAHEPEWFTTAPTIAAPKALKNAGMEIKDIDFFEVNEAFAVVTMAFNQVMGVDESICNVNGGACSLGHALGSSASRIIVTLLNVLEQNDAKTGLAAICNGGGGASAMILERV